MRGNIMFMHTKWNGSIKIPNEAGSNEILVYRLWKGGSKIFTLVCEILPFKNEIDDYLEKVSIRDEILLKLLVHLPTVSGSDCLAYVIYVMPACIIVNVELSVSFECCI